MLGCFGDDASSTGATESSTTHESTGSTESTESTESTGSSGSTASESTGPDAEYLRECQAMDFVCDDWGCEQPPVVRSGACYKPCTPTAVGEEDDECDEPERPFCSQVGLAKGGDWDCNGCAHICISEPIDQCNQGVNHC